MAYRQLVTALGVALAALSGCASTQSAANNTTYFRRKAVTRTL